MSNPEDLTNHPDLAEVSAQGSRAEVDMFMAIEGLEHAMLVGDYDLALAAHRKYTGDPEAELSPHIAESLKATVRPDPLTAEQLDRHRKNTDMLRQRAIDSLKADRPDES